jgi:hypothetical protein
MIGRLRTIAKVGLWVGVVSLITAFALEGATFTQFWEGAGRTLQGCGDDGGPTGAATERRLAWTGGDAIEIALPATVNLRMGQGNDIVMRGTPGAVSSVELRRDRLVLACRWPGSTRNLDITLPGQAAFRQIAISGAARLVMEDLHQPELALRISGSGAVRAKGAVERLSITISGSGNAQLGDLATKALTVKISGSGEVTASPKDEADVTISGSGILRLLTRPVRLNSHISGSGRVTQVN